MHSSALIVFLSIVGFSLGQQGDRKWGEFLQPRPIAQVTANPGIYEISSGSENAFPAWYHMPPKQQHSPPYGYNRQPQTNQQVDQSYRGYPSFNREPPSVGSSPYESPSSPRRPFPQPDPNAELLNAIRDVVSKFKASLDESGLDQDVRQMGRQLQNTWQQLRAAIEQADLRRASGLDRSWNALRLSAEQSLHPPVLPYGQGPASVNEQLSQMFARSQSQDAPKK